MHDSGNRILKALFILVWILALIHIAAESRFWYWTYRWLDIPMHVLGGVWLGLAVLWLRNHTHYMRCVWTHIPNRNIITALVGGIVVGLVWEAYEYTVWQYVGSGLPPQYLPDTLLDLVMDAVGALLGYGTYRTLTPQTSESATP